MVFIYQFEKHKAYFPLTHFLFGRLQKRKTKAVTSLVSFIKITSFPQLTGKDSLLADYKKIFLKTPSFSMINPDIEIAEKAAELRKAYKLRTPDAIQMATSIVNKAELFISNDDCFKKVKEIKTLVLKDFA